MREITDPLGRRQISWLYVICSQIDGYEQKTEAPTI